MRAGAAAPPHHLTVPTTFGIKTLWRDSTRCGLSAQPICGRIRPRTPPGGRRDMIALNVADDGESRRALRDESTITASMHQNLCFIPCAHSGVTTSVLAALALLVGRVRRNFTQDQAWFASRSTLMCIFPRNSPGGVRTALHAPCWPARTLVLMSTRRIEIPPRLPRAAPLHRRSRVCRASSSSLVRLPRDLAQQTPKWLRDRLLQLPAPALRGLGLR